MILFFILGSMFLMITIFVGIKIWLNKKEEDIVTKTHQTVVAFLVWVIFLMFTGIFTILPYFEAINFYGEARGTILSLPAYEQTIDMTGNIRYTVEESQLIMLYNAGELNLGITTGERVKEWRDIITTYNKKLGRYHEYMNIPLYWLIIPPVPEDIGYILVE